MNIAFYIILSIILITFASICYNILKDDYSDSVEKGVLVLIALTVTCLAILFSGIVFEKTVDTRRYPSENYEVVKEEDYVVFTVPNKPIVIDDDLFVYNNAKDTTKVWLVHKKYKSEFGFSYWSNPEIQTDQD